MDFESEYDQAVAKAREAERAAARSLAAAGVGGGSAAGEASSAPAAGGSGSGGGSMMMPRAVAAPDDARAARAKREGASNHKGKPRLERPRSRSRDRVAAPRRSPSRDRARGERPRSPGRRRASRSRSPAARPPREKPPAPKPPRGSAKSSSRRPRRSRSRSSSSSSSSSDGVAELLEGFLSDSDDDDERAFAWMRSHGYKARFERHPRPRIEGKNLLEVTRAANRLAVKGKYGNWDDYLRFLHRHSRRCRPPPGRTPEQQTPFLLRNFLRTLHEDDRTGDVSRVLKENKYV